MIIGIDASRVFTEKETGVEYYSRALLKALFKLGGKHQFILYSKRPLNFRLPTNFKNKVLKMPYLWTQIRLSLEMLFNPSDILFVPSHCLPIIHPRRSVVTIHDLGFKKYPTAYNFFEFLYLAFSTWYSVKTALKIIAISKTTKDDIIRYYKIPPKKIKVIYLGFKRRKPSTTFWRSDRQKVVLGKYILYIGRIDRKKNLKRLIHAFKLLKKEEKFPHRLFLVGKDGFGAGEIKKEASGESLIKFFGYQKDKRINELLAGASALVLPSLYEGFGMPVLEAFYLGIPVLASNIKSAREIYGNAALLVDPLSVKEIKKGLLRILTDENLRNELIKRGRQQAKNFSWQKCALETLMVLKNLSAINN